MYFKKEDRLIFLFIEKVFSRRKNSMKDGIKL